MGKTNWLLGGDYLDLKKHPSNIIRLLIIRFGIAVMLSDQSFHPDQNWQGVEMAYNLAYRDIVDNPPTWEWRPKYSLRTWIYPIYLSIPLHILRFLGLDANIMVFNSMIFMNTLLQVLGDYYLFHLAHDIMGRDGAIMTLGYSIFNRRICEIGLKTLTNGVEADFCIVALYHYNRLSPKLDKHMILMTFSLTIAFIVRSSSLTSWVPLALSRLISDP
jgi:hypothetical protein